MPRKVFVAGEILTAADVQEYLADQSVMTFASSAARGSAIGTAVEGMVTYLEDTDQLEVYGGTAVGWTSASNFLFGTATPTDGQVVSYSTAVSGYVPADAAGGGKLLQVVSTTKTDAFSSSSSSFVDITGLSATITPSSTSSQILVFASVYGSHSDTMLFQLLRDSTGIGNGASGFAMGRFAATNEGGTFGINHLDSPSSTSSLTYKVQGRLGGGSTWYVNRRAADTSLTLSSSITVMEIAG